MDTPTALLETTPVTAGLEDDCDFGAERQGDDPVRTQYFLAETVVSVTGRLTYIDDKYDSSERLAEGLSGATVSLAVRADVGNGAREFVPLNGWHDTKTDVKRTTDGRLTSVSFESAGTAGVALAAATKVIASVAGLAARFASPIGAVSMLHAESVQTPEQKAFTAWSGLVEDSASELAVLPGDVVHSDAFDG